jgi:hypothetical protein
MDHDPQLRVIVPFRYGTLREGLPSQEGLGLLAWGRPSAIWEYPFGANAVQLRGVPRKGSAALAIHAYGLSARYL